MGFIRRVDLNPRRAKFNLTFKLLGILSPMITFAVLLSHPIPQLVAKSFWLYPLTFIVRWIYLLCGPALWGQYIYRKLDIYMAGPPIAMAVIAIILWLSIFFKNKIDPQTVFLPVVLWLVAGTWTLWLVMLLGK